MPCLGVAGQLQQGGFLGFPAISSAGCFCREHLEEGEHKPGCLPLFMPLAHGAFWSCPGSGHSKKNSSFALLFFPLSQCKMLVWTLCSSLIS